MLVAISVQWVAFRPPLSGPHLRLSPLDAAVSSDGKLNAAVSVSNRRNAPSPARVWWILAKPGEGSEWDRRAYQSTVRSLDVPAGKTVKVEWSEAPLVPRGDYVVSAWVHAPGRQGFDHVDGRVGPSFNVEPRDGGLLRAGPSRFGIEVARVDSQVDVSDQPWLAVDVEIDNRAGSGQRAFARLAVGPVRAADDPDWWRVAPVWTTDSVALDLPANGSTRIRLAGHPQAPPGQYVIRVILEDVIRHLDGALDEVAVSSPLVSLPRR